MESHLFDPGPLVWKLLALIRDLCCGEFWLRSGTFGVANRCSVRFWDSSQLISLVRDLTLCIDLDGITHLLNVN